MSSLHVSHTRRPTGPAAGRGRSAIAAAAAMCLLASLVVLACASWIPIKAQVAQILLERAFAQSRATGIPVRPWPWADTWPVARINVPRLDRSAIVLHGATSEALAFGPAHLAETPRPGYPGTSVIAAHRDTHFRFLKHVEVGDRIVIERSDGARIRFRVTSLRIAEWNRTGIDARAPGHNLVMSTCYPFDSVVAGPQRFIVDAKRVETFPGSELHTPHT